VDTVRLAARRLAARQGLRRDAEGPVRGARPEHAAENATFEDGGNGVEAGVMEMLDRMQTGTLEGVLDLQRLAHRSSGSITGKTA
jgi:hypothetical protein